MKIADDKILMSSSRAFLENKDVKEELRVWVGESTPVNNRVSDQVSISSKAEELFAGLTSEREEVEVSENLNEEISLEKLIAEILTGRKVETISIDKQDIQNTGIESVRDDSQQTDQRQGWGLQYDYEETYSEKEDVRFESKGIIRTADGREIVFSLKLDMNREYIEKNNINIRAGDAAVDPLIINFDGNAADLTDMKFAFDLNSDGKTENISMPSTGRGFLAIDSNQDGIVNNGSELFGPSSGNGFAELSEYDADGNSWIDENDVVYNNLRIMTMNNQGESTLQTLKDSGVGAIYLGRTRTQFDIRTNADNSMLGQIRSTGIFLREDGTPGTIQQLDLVV